MRHLVIGDIHGCFAALNTLVGCVPILTEDMVITLGDYVNRGPDSRAVLDWLIARHQTYRLIPLRGNHELMMMGARQDVEQMEIWLDCGGDTTLASYGTPTHKGQIADVPAEHWRFLDQDTLPYYELPTHFFVHANAYHDHAMADQPDYMLYWERFMNPLPHYTGKIMVCGHTAQRSGLPRTVGHAVCIDTWVYGNGWLTCLDIATGDFWQANQRHQARRGNLANL